MAAPRFAIATRAAVGVERRSNDSASLPAGARPQANRGADTLQPDLAVDPPKRLRCLTTAVEKPGSGRRKRNLSEHRARSRYGRHDGRARGDDRSIPMSDRAQRCAAGRAGGAFTRRWGRARSDAPDARAGPATVDERTAGVLPQPARRTAVGVDDADAARRACRGDARRVWRARRCPWLVDGRQHRAAARGRSPGCGPAAGLDQHRLSSGTGRSDGAATRCRAILLARPAKR